MFLFMSFPFCIFFVVAISSMVSSTPQILFSVSCILLMMLASVAPDDFPKLSLSRVASLCVFFIVSILISVLSFIQFLHLIDCISLSFFKGFIHFLFKGF